MEHENISSLQPNLFTDFHELSMDEAKKKLILL